MAKTPRIYRSTSLPHVDIPNIDLVTLLFAQPETVLHVDAAHPDNKLTKADLIEYIERIAHGLRSQFGIGATGPSKDVVTVMSYGQIMVSAAYFGVVAAGGIYSAASPSSTVSELARQISIGKSNLIICGSEHKEIVTAAAKQCNVPLSRVLILESWPEHSLRSLEGGVNAISDQRLPWPRITEHQQLKKSIITILWSSGTTGLPKGVSLSHFNLVAEAYILFVQPRMFVMKQLETDPSSYKPMEYRTLAHLPISHIAGLGGYLILAMYNAGTVYWMRKYNWSDMLKYVRQYKVTAFYTVPSIYLRISKSADVTDHFQYVEAASTGAAPMDGKLQTASNRRLGNGKDTFIAQTWGLSETTGAVTAMPKGETDITGSVSPILPNVELRMVDENYQDVEPGSEGELLIRGPVVMEGYFNNEQETKAAFHDFKDDGKGPWFCSGDIGIMRDGMFYIVDRKKELLKYKGLQVAPAEIENLLFTHHAVAEAAVVGVPAPKDPGTELPRAYVVLSPGAASKTSAVSVVSASTSTWPVSPALNAQAGEPKAARNDSSKQDTLNQTRYSDVKGNAVEENLAKELQKFVAERLAPHKQLRGGVKFVAELPKNAIGKFLRRELRERAKKEIVQETSQMQAKL